MAVTQRLLPLVEHKQHEKTVIAKSKRKKRHSCYKPLSVIEQLNPELKSHVDSMIKSNTFSCQDIANYLVAHGVQISQMAVNRYAHKWFWDKEDT